MGENFFNYTTESMVSSNITSVNSSKLEIYEHETLLNIFIIVTIITLVLCAAGWYVEFSKAFNKPN